MAAFKCVVCGCPTDQQRCQVCRAMADAGQSEYWREVEREENALEDRKRKMIGGN